MTTMAPETVGESLDPRDPLLRLSTFLRRRSVELLHERDRSGPCWPRPHRQRRPHHCVLQPTAPSMGGAMGTKAAQHRQCLRHPRSRSRAPSWASALRWCAAGRGRKGAAPRFQFGVRGD